MLMAGLRNILVHDYLDVDRGRIPTFVQDRLENFEEFAVQLAGSSELHFAGAGPSLRRNRLLPIPAERASAGC